MTDLTLLLVGVVGGILAGVSPCVLPVLPVVLVGGAGAAQGGERAPSKARPVAIVAGLVLSFSLFTLFGSLLLSLLHLPADLIRWVGIAALLLLGLAMLFPPLERLLERPFARLPQRVPGGRSDGAGGGFLLGVALGAVYVPCAGPVLATIAVAGATDRIGPRTLLLTAAFAIGTAIPLLVVALAGRGLADRVKALQHRQRGIRVAGGVVVIALAVALALNVTDVIQRRIPDYTQAVGGKLGAAVAPAVAGTGSLQRCQQDAFTGGTALADCGKAPEIAGITAWLGDRTEPRTLDAMRGKVVLIDFWAYSCINCQRELPHVEAWWKNYRDSGFEVIGVHTPEYAFERDTGNIESGIAKLGLTFPVAVDNDHGTWNAYRNVAWPAGYLIDATGTVRLVTLGEGKYDKTEESIRSLLLAARPGAHLPSATDLPDTTPRTVGQTPETYLGAARQQNFAGDGYEPGTRTFTPPPTLDQHRFALSGTWTVGPDDIRAGDGARVTLAYHARRVYLNVAGTGTLTVTEDGATRTVPVSGPPDIRTVVDGAEARSGNVTVALSPGLTAYSFTFG
ncbi:cytochrome c biogenesis protein CcdA [Tsukamurella sp. 1534]|uniref:redoxin domain-containing protein n=1 Tax=Tsukamurella sp. 1534 TaxID=1151061 RepID=UPI0002D2F14E|nr:cytochrome c biogenesis protein CcdA [Tsukamurella sp. 1534]